MIIRTYRGSIPGWGTGSRRGCMMEQRDLCRKLHRWMLSATDEKMAASEARPQRWVVRGMWVRAQAKMTWRAVCRYVLGGIGRP